MRHVWSILCQDAVIDRDTNLVSLFKCIEGASIKFTGGEPPTVIAIPFKLVTFWTRSNLHISESGEARMCLLSPIGDVLHEARYTVDLSEHRRNRTVANVSGIPYRGDGLYEFRTETEAGDSWRELARVPLEITVESGAS